MKALHRVAVLAVVFSVLAPALMRAETPPTSDVLRSPYDHGSSPAPSVADVLRPPYEYVCCAVAESAEITVDPATAEARQRALGRIREASRNWADYVDDALVTR